MGLTSTNNKVGIIPLLNFVLALTVFYCSSYLHAAVDVSPTATAPYSLPSSSGTGVGDSLQAAVQSWWGLYKRNWGVKPYGNLDCSYNLTSQNSGSVVAHVQLTGQCGGGGNVFGTLSCPQGYTLAGSTCAQDGVVPNKNPPNSCPVAGNPISLALGVKYQKEVDYQHRTNPLLGFSRIYSTHSYSDINSIAGWRTTYSRRVHFRNNGIAVADVVSDDGVVLPFVRRDGAWLSDPGVQAVLSEALDDFGARVGWNVQRKNLLEIYDADGKLVLVKDTNGNQVGISYAAGTELISQVVDQLGREILLRNDGGLLVALVTPEGNEFEYMRDEMVNLVEVFFTEFATSVKSPLKTYHYENLDFPHHLTGITDANNTRFASWAYDSQGRATSSEHAGGTERIVATYNTDESVSILNELGKTTTYHFRVFQGVRKVSEVEGHQSANCAAANKNYAYYPSGLLETKTDWKNNTTSYQYNTRNLESSRTEALGTPQERTITTEWHPTFNLRTKVTEPGRETNFIYDAEGRLLSQSSSETPLQ